MPGWPLFAFWTASIARVRMVSMQSCASALVLVAIASEYEHGPDRTYARGALRGAARLRLRAEVPPGGRSAAGLSRRGRGPARRLLARRADVVVPVAQGHPGRPRRRLPLHR